MNKKRVLNLYRVSTKMQVKENDIPMQKAECTKYIRLHCDWELFGERSEKGISGFKNTSQDRDVLNEIMEMAHRKEFDILLVYMSDRLGRREDDTPFYVADLNRLGIEVWSVNEGQLKTQEHIDKLMNYIRFWNAEGESLKTSVRVRDAQLEMLKRGEYTGGGCPYGYNQVFSGKYNNKGRALKKLEINPAEADVVKKIFDLSTDLGMGGYRIAQELNNGGTPAKKGGRWTLCTINNMLRNPIYKGYYTYGKGKTKGKRGRTAPDEWIYSDIQHTELVIIEEAYWNQAQLVREARTPVKYRKENITYNASPALTDCRLLLMGLVYCGYCGGRLSNGTAYDKWTTKDGIMHKKMRGQYKCIAKSQGGVSCTGKFIYKQEPLEETVLEAVSNYINSFSACDILTELEKRQQQRCQKDQKELQTIQSKINSIKKDIETFIDQLPQAIRKEFVLSPEELQEVIKTRKMQLKEYSDLFLKKQQELAARQLNFPKLKQLCTIVPKWDTFTDLSSAQKRLFLAALIERISVKKEEIEIRMRIRLEDFIPPNPDSDASTSH